MRPRVVIVGGGFAGFAAARAFEKAKDGTRVDVTLVNPQNFMLFTPMLPEAASGSIEPRHIVEPLRVGAHRDKTSRRGLGFELGEAIGVDTDRRTVAVRHPLTHDVKQLGYDELVLALGATDSTMGVPGAERFTLPLRSLSDAERLRERIVGALEVASECRDLIERDRLLRFVIVGGNFTGVELAGELQAFLRSTLSYYPNVDAGQVEVVILESGDRLLGNLPAKFGDYAASVLVQRGTRLMLGEKASAVDSRGVELEGGRHVASATVVWAAGAKPAALAEHLGLETDEHGAIKAGSDFAVPGRPHIWAVGDCAAIPRPGGGTYAPLAQNAVREGPLLASNILARLRGKTTKPFRYRELGQMASLGDRQAVAELPGGRILTGTPAWIAWRTYYLSRLPGLGRKARVAVDWTLGILLPPDIARLPVTDRASFEEDHAPRG